MLNPSQNEAVKHINGPLLILAGAGAGKTHTLTERVGYMINECNINPSSILCVTFTNKAAKEMKERILKKLGRDEEIITFYRNNHSFPVIGTFHSIGVYFLRLFIDKIGYDKNFSILDEDDKIKIVKEILEEKNIDSKEFGARPIAYAISNAKNNSIDSRMYSLNVKSYFEEKVAEIYEIYEKKLKQMNSLDFDDILIKTYEILDIPEVLSYLQERFKYFMIDEYQDTNEIQYKIVKKLGSLTENVCVVGDDWQGIYSWRGANIKNIFNFQRDYANCLTVKLEQNYRSTKNIIEAANTVVKNNKTIMDKTLWTENDTGDKIILIDTQDEKHEAEIVAKEIREILDEKEENIAILYRTNGQSRLIEEALLNKGIPYTVYGGLKFYERKEIKDILAYLRILSNPHDVISFKRIINTPSRKIGAKSVEVLINYLENYRLDIFSLLDMSDDISELTPQARKGTEIFRNIIGTLKNKISELSLDELLWKIIEVTDYERYLLDEYGQEEYEAKMDNLKEFKNMAARYIGIKTPDALSMFLEEIALITDMDREKNNDHIKVSLMTIHLSKGLEFDNVFIVGAEEGIFPHSRSLQEQKELEEERRLMYVAMTRAKKYLAISRAKERFYFGSFSANPQSRFVREIPVELTDNKSLVKDNYNPYFNKYSAFSVSLETGITNPTAKKEKILNDPNTFKLGDRVEHFKFGIGTIVSITGSMADIAFSGGQGIKKMNIEIAPIKKI